jgi:hypothetical protein
MIKTYLIIIFAIILLLYLIRNIPKSTFEQFEKVIQILGGCVVIITVVLAFLSYKNEEATRIRNSKVLYTSMDDKYVVQLEAMIVKFPIFERPNQLLNAEEVDLEKKPLSEGEKHAAYHLSVMYAQIIEDLYYIGTVSKSLDSDYGWSSVFYTWVTSDIFVNFWKYNRISFLRETDDYIQWLSKSDIKDKLPDLGEYDDTWYKYFRNREDTPSSSPSPSPSPVNVNSVVEDEVNQEINFFS